MMRITKKELEQHAATSVALFWLKYCKQVIERGEKPSKLTPLAYILTRDELDMPIYGRFKKFNVSKIAQAAVLAAKQRLQLDPKWELVRAHFGVPSAHGDK